MIYFRKPVFWSAGAYLYTCIVPEENYHMTLAVIDQNRLKILRQPVPPSLREQPSKDINRS